MIRTFGMSLTALGLALANASDARAADAAPMSAESFPIGNSGSVCEAQGVALGMARQSVFERKWMLLCRDVARPVGHAYVLNGADPLSRIGKAREEALDCRGETRTGEPAPIRDCVDSKSGLAWRSYMTRRGDKTYIVEGLAAYDSALQLALSSLATNRVQPGEVAAAALASGDVQGLLRARAAVSDASTLIGQGYRGNSAGAYAEAAELFAAAPALLGPGERGEAATREAQVHEVRVNRALQLSNLGAFDQASRDFAEARDMAGRDGVQARLGRNFEAIDAINRGDLASAGTILARAMPPVSAVQTDADGALIVDAATAAAINAGKGADSGLLGQETHLSPLERAAILDAQALQLKGSALRLGGQPEAARAAFAAAYQAALGVRGGRVVSITRLRAQVLSEMALTYEREGKLAEAEGLLRQAQMLVESQYPDSASVNAARARLAGFLIRNARADEAVPVYRQIVETVAGNRGALVGLANLMRPYFDWLSARAGSDTAAAGDLFMAAQLVERPGAADSLSQLSRRLEAGNDVAADLFRRSLILTREIERTRIRLAQINAAAAEGGAAGDVSPETLRNQIARLSDQQAKLLGDLSAYPQFRAVTRKAITLDDLRGVLRPGEGYLKLAVLGGSAYAVFVTPQQVRGWKLDASAATIGDEVAALRNSISTTVNGVQSTYPFDIDKAAALYASLIGPMAGDLAGVRHLVFEPDGPLLELPINLLTGDREGIRRYHARVASGGDDYDFTGIDWLGRDRAVSTALSAASFRDVRQAPASKATRAYLGFGQNAPLGPISALPSATRGGVMAQSGCEWPVETWNRPISDAELQQASGILRGGRPETITGSAFTDSAIKAQGDLGQFRIVHFATHGLVTPPREGCPARPALVTSFGTGDSDGLLSFGEIFDLQLDADLVILSACDTAGQASEQATAEAGVTTGGGQALDGLVRAFIAAGGRDVIASHWPAPDDFNATRRLFTGFFAGAGKPVGDALRASQRALMDDPQTSHPFYWAGFAIVGDGSRNLPGQ